MRWRRGSLFPLEQHAGRGVAPVGGEGKLQDPQVLEAQVRRMLKDSRAKALADNFAGQWLTLRANVAPARRLFPEWNNDLRQAMRKETELFFQEVVKQDRSILDFLDGRFTYLNERLAKLYDIEGIKGEKFQRVDLTANKSAGGSSPTRAS